ncbi:MAG: extracellular solute-binding protein, partial [Chloroflexi bacterium]|nr:extracellular solute-binding protein [Chloroflexota bacterium]
MNTKHKYFVLLLMVGLLMLTGCQPQEVETVVVTQIVDGEVVEVVVTEIVEVEVIVDPTECNLDAPAEEVEINMIGWSFPITDFYAEEVAKCDKVENLTVNTNLLANDDAREQVRLALSAGGDSPYDIVHGANSQVGAWAGVGWMMPLNDLVDKYWDEYNLGDIPEKAWEGATIDGQIYGVPIVGNTLHLMYNQDIFDEFGIDVPDTYDEVIDACNTIGLDNPDYDVPFTITLSAGWAWEIEFFQMLRAYGGDYLNEDSTAAFNSEAGVNAANKIAEVADACMGDVGYSMGNNDIEVAVQLGTLPFTNLWASRGANMEDPDRTDLVGVIKFAPAPRATVDGPRAGSAWNDYYMIPANTTNDPDLIFRIIMEAADERSQRDAAELGMTTRLAVAEYGGGYLPAASQTIAEGIGIYSTNPANGIAVSKLSEFLPLVGNGEMTAEEALNAAAEAYNQEATDQGY